MTGGIGAIAGMCFFAIGCVLTMLWLHPPPQRFLQIVTESAEGNRRNSKLAVAARLVRQPLVPRRRRHDECGSRLGDQPDSAAASNPNCERTGDRPWASSSVWPVMILSQLAHQFDLGNLLAANSWRVWSDARSRGCCSIWKRSRLRPSARAAMVFIAGKNPMTALWLMPLYCGRHDAILRACWADSPGVSAKSYRSAIRKSTIARGRR